MTKYFTNVQTAEQAKARYRELCREYHPDVSKRPDAHRDTLKTLGFGWAAKKQAWYYHKGEYKRRGKKEIPLDDIKARYGCTRFDSVQQARLA